jgi:hypothetical protein
MGTPDFVDALASASLSSSVNLEKALLGRCLTTPCKQVLILNLASEVYKARSRRDGSIVALKKILMHNEKDGVR